MSNPYFEGKKSRAICYKCKKTVTSTFKYAPLKLKGFTIPNVLQAHCDICDEPCSVPHQETHKIKEFFDSIRKDKNG